MRVILASRVPVLAIGLSTVLRERASNTAGSFVTFADGRQVIEHAREHGFDLALIEFNLDGLNGLDVARTLVQHDGDGRVILLLQDPQPQLVTGAIEANVSGIVHVECSRDDLERAVDTVLTGEPFLCPVCTSTLVAVTASPEPAEVDPVISTLTPREREILQLLAEGLSTRDVSTRLNISSKTVDTHRRHVMSKLDADSVAELVKCALRSGLTTL